MFTELTGELISSLMPVRSDLGHKNSFGELLVHAGSPKYTGALLLCVSSALRSGAGLVRAFAPKEALMPVRIGCPCALISSYEDGPNLLSLASGLLASSSAVVTGPGIDISDGRQRDLLMLLVENAPKLLIDASSLTILSKLGPEVLRIRRRNGLSPAVLTPHIGEFRRFGTSEGADLTDIGSESFRRCVTDFARENDAILILKNHATVITTPEGECYYIKGDNSGMAKGGSGDVLAGLTGGLMASGLDPLDAARVGVYVHSMAGRLAAEELTKLFMLPTDLIFKFPEVYKKLGW